MKQYIVLSEESIAKAPVMYFEKMTGTFIECPHCEKLVRVIVEKNAEKKDIEPETK